MGGLKQRITLALDRLAILLENRAWPWFLPLVWIIIPAWLAWNHTSLVPHADAWFMGARGYLDLLGGKGTLWDFIHAPGNDSRHDVPHLFNWIVYRFFGGDLRIEALICVIIAGCTTAMLLWMLRSRLQGPVLWRWLVAWLAAGHVLSAFQWMNWAWGVQICYAVVVWGCIGAVAAMQTTWALPWRTLAAAGCAAAATLSFLNGWLAWGLIGLMLLVEAFRSGWRNRAWLTSVAILAGAFALTVWYFFLDWPEAKVKAQEEMVQGFAAHPLKYVLFFLRVIAAPVTEMIPTLDKDLRNDALWAVSPWIGAAVLALWGITLGVLLRRRKELDWTKVVPWLLLALLGFGNAAALTLARSEHAYAIPFECRYPAYTQWLHVGLLALMGLFVMPWQKIVRLVWVLVAVVWGGAVGALQGFWDSERIHDAINTIEAAVTLRHVAVEPVQLDSVSPTSGPKVIEWLDELEHFNLLGVATVRSPRVTDAEVRDLGDLWEGQFKESEFKDGGVVLRGWALNRKTKHAADAVAISVQPAGGEEVWLGLATKRTREMKLAERKNARVQNHRIGWAYEPLTGKETSMMTTLPLKLKRNALPKGPVTFRAYVMDAPSGTFWRLPGEHTLTLP